MAYFTREQLEGVGFRSLGNNVLVSDKASIYNPDQIEIGDNSRIDDFCVISGKVTLGRNVHVAVFCNLAGGERGIVLEDFCGISYGCQVFTQSDDYSGQTLTGATIPDHFKNISKAAIRIGRHSIVGSSSIIMPGVTLAEGTSVGAMSMVMKNTTPWSIYVGIPAKKIKNRCRDLLSLEQQYLNEGRV